MQPHQLVLAIGILWLITLVALPLLFATARRRAHAAGLAEGKAIKDAAHMHQNRKLQRDLADKQAELVSAQKAFTAHMEARRQVITELEERIMSYTGLAVTKADYDNLVNASSTMRLAQRTLKALKSLPQADRAADHAEVLDGLAKRVHAQLRATPASSSTGGVSA